MSMTVKRTTILYLTSLQICLKGCSFPMITSTRYRLMSFQYHCTCGESKKIITVVSNDELLEKIVSAFALSSMESVTLQVFSSDWDEWVDVQNVMELTTKSKLKVIKGGDTLSSLNPILVFSPTTTNSITTSSDPMTTSHSSSPTMTSSPISTPTSALTLKRTAESVAMKAWPVIYTLPVEVFRPDLLEALQAKANLNRKFRLMLVQACFDNMLQYTKFPSPSHYLQVASAIVVAYPHLRDNVLGCKGYESWRTALSDKFRNERRNMVDDDIISRRVRRKISSIVTAQANHKVALSKEWNHPEGENDETILEHKKWLKAESSKAKPDLTKMKLLMEVTFADRRMMVAQDMKIQEVFEQYPALFTQSMIERELQMMFERDLEKVFLQRLGVNAQKILSILPQSEKENLLSFEEQRKLTTSVDEQRYMTAAAALWFLAGCFKGQNRTYLMAKPDQLLADSSAPVIVYDGEFLSKDCLFKIFAEGVEICRPVDAIQAVMSLVGTYFIFNIAYPNPVKLVLLYLQQELLDISEVGQDYPKSLRRMIHKINSLV